MATDELTLDALLLEQSATANHVVVEAIENDAEHVWVTPLESGMISMCSAGIKVQKSAIKGVKKLDKTVHCCGKDMLAVEIEFSSEKLVTYAELISATREAHTAMVSKFLKAMGRLAPAVNTEAQRFAGQAGGVIANPNTYGRCMVMALTECSDANFVRCMDQCAAWYGGHPK